MELGKIDTLEEKIKDELANLEKKTEAMTSDLQLFQNLQVAKEQGDARKIHLEEQNKSLKREVTYLQVWAIMNMHAMVWQPRL